MHNGAADVEQAAAAPAVLKRRGGQAKATPTPRPTSCLAPIARPPTWRVKTLAPHWRALRSRWRYVEGMFYYLGPPSFTLSRIWPAMVANLAVFALVAADHIVEAVASRHAAAAAAAAAGGGHHTNPVHGGRGIFPPLSASVAASLDPVFRLSLFAVSLLITLRLGRVVDRWLTARRAFTTFGSVALTVAQRTSCMAPCRGGGGAPAAATAPAVVGRGEAARWAVLWQFAMHQLVTNSKAIHPAGAALMTPAERELYAAHPKGRQFASQRLTQLLLGADGGGAVGGPVNAGTLLDRAQAAQGDLTGIFLQALPSAVTTMSTGATQAFLLLYPLSALTRSSGGGGGGGGSGSGGALGGAMPTAAQGGEVTAMSVAGAGGVGGHDVSLPSVLFTLGVQGLLYAFVCLLFLSLCATAAELENPFASLPLESIIKSTVRDVARTLEQDRRVRAALDGVDGGGDEAPAFDWTEAVRLSEKSAEEKRLEVPKAPLPRRA